jgi:hypothetical protein
MQERFVQARRGRRTKRLRAVPVPVPVPAGARALARCLLRPVAGRCRLPPKRNGDNVSPRAVIMQHPASPEAYRAAGRQLNASIEYARTAPMYGRAPAIGACKPLLEFSSHRGPAARLGPELLSRERAAVTVQKVLRASSERGLNTRGAVVGPGSRSSVVGRTPHGRARSLGQLDGRG